MRSRAGRVVLGVVLLATAIVLFAVFKSSNSSDEGGSEHGARPHHLAGQPGGASVAAPTIVIRHGEPVGGVKELTFNRGEWVAFNVDSDVSDEVHVHGYDVMKDVTAGGAVGFRFRATIEGLFEGELEHRGEQILELRINP